MARQQPINAEVPSAGGPPEGEPPKRRRRPRLPRLPRPPRIPRAPRIPRPPLSRALRVAAAVALLVAVFMVAAVVGGGGGGGGSGVDGVAFPAFATKNTSRVGGGSPVADAAGVALAVYPSTRPGQRPHAVTLVDEAEWQAALAASVLAGPHFRSPILFTGRDGLPDVSREALDTLDPQGAGTTHGAAVFAIGRAEAPGGRPAAHAGGKSPALVAASIARLRDRLGGSPAEAIVIASEDNPAFAMPAAAWAARSGDPVLFASRDRLPKATAGALRKNRHAAVFVLGPSSTISSKVVRRIAKIDGHVRRVSGEDPVANAIAFARYRHGSFGWDINDPGHGFVVARSDSPLDAAAAAPLSASGTWGPLLLSDDADTLPGALRAYLLDVKPGYTSDPTRAFYNHVWVIGDQSAISVEQQAEIDSLAELAKIGGKEP